MHTRRLTRFTGLILAVVSTGYGQQHATPTSPKAAPKKAAPAGSPLAMPPQQGRFCAVFEQDVKRQNDLEEKKAEATNPIGAAQAEHEKPDFERLFRAQQSAVMGKGAFENWVGYAIPAVDDFHRAYLQVEFPCKWTLTWDNREQSNNLYLTSKTAFAIDSPEAKELAKLKPREKVFVSGSLSCGPVTAFVGSGGCEGDAYRNGKQIVRAEFASIRSEKTGEVLRVGKDPDYKPELDHFKDVDILRRNKITFYRTDSLETLQTKAFALVAKKPDADSIKLLEFLLIAPQCDRCKDSLGAARFTVFEPNANGVPAIRQHPCKIGTKEQTCGEGFSAVVPSDFPALKSVDGQGGKALFVPTNDGTACAAVSSTELKVMQDNLQKISDKLMPLGLQLVDPISPRKAPQSAVCDALNAAETKRASVAEDDNKQYAETLKAVAANVTADEFGALLAKAVRTKASQVGSDVSQYEDSIKQVTDIVRLCASMLGADYAAAVDPYGTVRLARYKNGIYKGCDIEQVVRRGDQPGLVIRPDLRNQWDGLQRLWYAPFFHVNILLTPLKDDHNFATHHAYDIRYLALSADVTRPGPIAAPRYICPGIKVRVPLSDDMTTLNTAAKITNVTVRTAAKGGVVSIEVDEPRGLYDVTAEQIMDSCAPGGKPATILSASARTESVTTKGQICMVSKMFTSPTPTDQMQNNTRQAYDAIARAGEDILILERNQTSSRIHLERAGRQYTGWVPNRVICPDAAQKEPEGVPHGVPVPPSQPSAETAGGRGVIPTTASPANQPPNAQPPAQADAVLRVHNYLPRDSGANPLGAIDMRLLRHDLDTALRNAGIPVPPGKTASDVVFAACHKGNKGCDNFLAPLAGEVAAKIRADYHGQGAFPALPPGTYYFLTVSFRSEFSAVASLKPGLNELDLH